MRWIGALCVVLVSVGAGVPAGAQDAPPAGLPQIVDQVVRPAMAKGGIPGAAVGISLRGHTYVFPYGRANDRGDAFTADTLVEIGSCTKVFTATLLALAADAHQLSLDDSIQKYMPSGATLTPSAQHVTLLQLATMSAGMPRFPTNLPTGSRTTASTTTRPGTSLPSSAAGSRGARCRRRTSIRTRGSG